MMMDDDAEFMELASTEGATFDWMETCLEKARRDSYPGCRRFAGANYHHGTFMAGWTSRSRDSLVDENEEDQAENLHENVTS